MSGQAQRDAEDAERREQEPSTTVVQRANVAPEALHAALDLTWSSVQSEEADDLYTTDEQDQDVLEQLRKLDAIDLRRSGFALLVLRSLAMSARAER